MSIRDRLAEDGLFFVGIDLIGDRLVEINCVSPGGIPRINRLEKVRLEEKVIDFIEQRVEKLKLQSKRTKEDTKNDKKIQVAR